MTYLTVQIFIGPGAAPPQDAGRAIPPFSPDDDDDDGHTAPERPQKRPEGPRGIDPRRIALSILLIRLEREYGESWWEAVNWLLEANEGQLLDVWASRPWERPPDTAPERLVRFMWGAGVSEEELELEIPLPGPTCPVHDYPLPCPSCDLAAKGPGER